MCIVCTIHVWCALCHTIIKGYSLTYLPDQTGRRYNDGVRSLV